ncbi:unnamed protein product [Cyprideis torosa]|uniref:Uncharacterized protein n=1 Tax=Cyprideis torosa TaxID=163714 RepID=A0A7R8ZIX0_9CRUS|nr:unnamed protein product [Cyprideis torosa]CAG0887223.1 unnamed protein product [Cyprideis torosa]
MARDSNEPIPTKTPTKKATTASDGCAGSTTSKKKSLTAESPCSGSTSEPVSSEQPQSPPASSKKTTATPTKQKDVTPSSTKKSLQKSVIAEDEWPGIIQGAIRSLKEKKQPATAQLLFMRLRKEYPRLGLKEVRKELDKAVANHLVLKIFKDGNARYVPCDASTRQLKISGTSDLMKVMKVMVKCVKEMASEKGSTIQQIERYIRTSHTMPEDSPQNLTPQLKLAAKRAVARKLLIQKGRTFWAPVTPKKPKASGKSVAPSEESPVEGTTVSEPETPSGSDTTVTLASLPQKRPRPAKRSLVLGSPAKTRKTSAPESEVEGSPAPSTSKGTPGEKTWLKVVKGQLVKEVGVSPTNSSDSPSGSVEKGGKKVKKEKVVKKKETEKKKKAGNTPSSTTTSTPATKKKTSKASSKTPTTTSTTPHQDINSQAMCAECLGTSAKNPRGQYEEVICCEECGGAAHPSCLNLSPQVTARLRTLKWQCEECKTCTSCGDKPEEGTPLSICSACDRGYHNACLNLESAPPKDWTCPLCVIAQTSKRDGTAPALAKEEQQVAEGGDKKKKKKGKGEDTPAGDVLTPISAFMRQVSPFFDGGFACLLA